MDKNKPNYCTKILNEYIKCFPAYANDWNQYKILERIIETGCRLAVACVDQAACLSIIDP